MTEKSQPRAALLLIDVQNDFCPGGALPVSGGDRVIPALNRAIDRFRSAGRPIYASRDWHPPDTEHFQAFGGRWPVHCVAGTPGAQLHPDLEVPPDAVVISTGQTRQDEGYSAFEGETSSGRMLADDLRERGVSQLWVGGLATDYCVRASVLDARAAGFDVLVLTDGIAGIEPETTRKALDEMERAGARLVTTDEMDNDQV